MDDYGLKDKVGLIAGGGSRDEGIGNGRGAAILLARAGAKAVSYTHLTLPTKA